jgi:hypothetical protein
LSGSIIDLRKSDPERVEAGRLRRAARGFHRVERVGPPDTFGSDPLDIERVGPPDPFDFQPADQVSNQSGIGGESSDDELDDRVLREALTGHEALGEFLFDPAAQMEMSWVVGEAEEMYSDDEDTTDGEDDSESTADGDSTYYPGSSSASSQDPTEPRLWGAALASHQKRLVREAKSARAAASARRRWERRTAPVEIAEYTVRQCGFARLALACHVTGIRGAQLDLFAALLDLSLPCAATRHKYLNEIGKKLIAFGRARLDELYRDLPGHVTAALDGSWCHRRNCCQGYVVVVELDRGLVIDLQIKTEDRRLGRSRKVVPGNYDGAAQALESAAVREFALHERERNEGGKIVRIVTDLDVDTMKVITDVGLTVEHAADANHVRRAFQNSFTSFIERREAGKPGRNLLGELEPGLKAWWNTCARMEGPIEERVQAWMGSFDHYTAATSQWSLAQDERARVALRRFLENGADSLRQIQMRWTTNRCEAFNALRSGITSKHFDLPVSWMAQVWVAVLRWNWGHAWIPDFCDYASIRLTAEQIEMLTTMNQRLIDSRERARGEQRQHNEARIRRTETLRARRKRGDVEHAPPTSTATSPVAGLSGRAEAPPPEALSPSVVKRLQNPPTAKFRYESDRTQTQGLHPWRPALVNRPTTGTPRFCHANSVVQLMWAERAFDRGVAGPGRSGDALAGLMARAAEAVASIHPVLDAEFFYQMLGRTPPFPIDWFDRFRSPSETWDYLAQALQLITVDGQAFTTLYGCVRCAIQSCECGARVVDRRWLPSLMIRSCELQRGAVLDSDGDWLMSFSPVRSPGLCPTCAAEISCRRVLMEAGRFLPLAMDRF